MTMLYLIGFDSCKHISHGHASVELASWHIVVQHLLASTVSTLKPVARA